MNNELLKKYDEIIKYCFEIFEKKQKDYGPTWILNRYSSLVDEIWRKIKRIRTLEVQNDNSLIPEGRDIEYIGIINYCIMYLIRLDSSNEIPLDEEVVEDLSKIDCIKEQDIFNAYKNVTNEIRELLYRKNSDYGDAWKSMEIYSMTDQVIIRVYRIKTILNNNGKCKISEGISAQLQDIINYCVFALIKMNTKIINF